MSELKRIEREAKERRDYPKWETHMTYGDCQRAEAAVDELIAMIRAGSINDGVDIANALGELDNAAQELLEHERDTARALADKLAVEFSTRILGGDHPWVPGTEFQDGVIMQVIAEWEARSWK